jgi:two-component system sensor histidine kinase/response regulator
VVMEVKKSLVLIVDDISTNIEFISDIILPMDNIEVHGVTSGNATFEFIDKRKPDLILLDISMPEMDGFEVCTRLKSDPDNADIPIIFLTARVQKEDLIKGFEVGAIDYISKPFNLAELKSRINTHLDLRQKTIELKAINTRLEEKVTERTKQLRLSNEKLSQTNKDLTKAYQELKTLDDAKNDFIAHINHELRTPLNGILGYTSILDEFELDDELKSYLKLINSLVFRLVRVAETSLILTELKTVDHKIKISSVSLNDIILDVLKRIDIETKNLKVQLNNLEKPIAIYAESRLLSVCLSLIIDNAVKYSPENGTINIQVEKKQKTIILNISDEGPGFSLASKKQVFELFTADNLQYSTHGFGIGLATAKRIIDLLGGKISIQNNKIGASVILELSSIK